MMALSIIYLVFAGLTILTAGAGAEAEITAGMLIVCLVIGTALAIVVLA